MTGFLGRIWMRARDRKGLPGFLLFVFLLPFSAVYRAGLAASRARRRAMPRWERGVPVLTVGNISTGGTGKTPLVVLLAERLARDGRRPAVLSRGYRGKRKEDPCVVKAFGGSILLDAGRAGDEARLIAEKLGEHAAVVVARDRVKGCALAVDRLGADVLILDDGFQSRMRFPRGFHVVTVNAARPLKGHLLPAGDLREPVPSLADAHAVVLTHAEETEARGREVFAREVRAVSPGAVIAAASHELSSLADRGTGESFDPGGIAGRKVLAFSALAYPEGFEKLLAKSAGARVAGFRAPDHHRWNEKDFARLRRALRSENCEVLVTTEKDAARVAKFPDFGVPLLVAKLRFSFVDGEPELESAIKSYLESF